jgi:hypothetical protein
MLAHVLVGGARRQLAPVEQDLFRLGELGLGAMQAVLDLLARGGDLLAGLAGGGAQQLLRVGDHNLQVLRELVFGDCGFGGHGILSDDRVGIGG